MVADGNDRPAEARELGGDGDDSGSIPRQSRVWTVLPDEDALPHSHSLSSDWQAAMRPFGVIESRTQKSPRLVASYGLPEDAKISVLTSGASSCVESGKPASSDTGWRYLPVGHCDGFVTLVFPAPSAPKVASVELALPLGGELGHSQVMRELARQIERYAQTDLRVALLGETGCGKTMIARLLHDRSPRRHKPFEVIDCSGLPADLLESKIFGHEKGAFTGAIRQRRGALEAARGGTIFFDEIGELTPQLQTRLLNVVESRFRRVGADHGEKEMGLDVRVIVATNRDIVAMVQRGEFREDLMYRLVQVAVHVPPLRERDDDLLLLADKFVKQLSTKTGIPKYLGMSAHVALKSRSWTGNVRELKNVIEVAFHESNGEVIEGTDFPVSQERCHVPESPLQSRTMLLPPPPSRRPTATAAADAEPVAPDRNPAPKAARPPLDTEQIKKALSMFVRRWPSDPGGAAPTDTLAGVLSAMGGGRPGGWFEYLRQGPLAHVERQGECNELSADECAALQDEIIELTQAAGSAPGLLGYAAAFARLLGAQRRSHELARRLIDKVGRKAQ